MSKYTTEVRWIVEENSDPSLSTRDRIVAACPYIFNFDYPIWENNYRTALESKILSNYYTREIGFETVGLWKFYLAERLNLIMPYYIDLHKSIEQEYDFLTEIDYEETFSENRNRTENKNNFRSSEGVSDRTTGSKHSGTNANTTTENDTLNSNRLLSDTPQANYANLDYATNLETNDSTTVNKTNGTLDFEDTTNTDDNVKNTSSETGNETNNTGEINAHTIKRKGNLGKTKSDMIIQYRKTLINIDYDIIKELEDLFMLIY